MPWKPEDATKHTKRAQTAAQRRQWAHVANGVLARTGGNEAAAIKAADEVLKQHPSKKAK